MAAAARSSAGEVLPPALGAVSEPPPLFDGTTRLYICYFCPFAQRAWVTRNCKGLREEIKLVGIDLQDKPAWYKEKVYPRGTVPSLEHDGKVTGESLDLIKYIDSNFEGPALLPQDPAKRQFADELIAYAGAFTKALYSPLTSQVDMSDDTVAALDKIEAALSKFSDGPFFLGQFSLADIAYVTILERVQIYYSHLRNYEIAKGRPNLEKYIEEMNKIEAYTQTKNEPLNLLDMAKRHLKIA
ncbi:protein IN2-1 homolog A [Brachypodium distachyon]|uniref:GST N-terminal domain-containing protein n=1 Tax=Brachypodium distachyon TaxID=15368 RepID=I1H6R5_BRADI|nr:protein IN2-1 homolog A [Brachypodium distachyon]KQK22239.1 hypothetical protein BRADI_1g66020v3 [Brachypodium distachyon]|eukprot:XP_010228765.1 protein IN2-1 homolog A [Brachypodium distachyon]